MVTWVEDALLYSVTHRIQGVVDSVAEPIVDPDEPMRARLQAEYSGRTCVRVANINPDSLELTADARLTESFDVIVLRHWLHRTPHPVGVLGSLRCLADPLQERDNQGCHLLLLEDQLQSIAGDPGDQKGRQFVEVGHEFLHFLVLANDLEGVLDQAAQYEDVLASQSLRCIASVSMAIDAERSAQLEQIFNAPIIQSYGSSEAGLISVNPLPPRTRKRPTNSSWCHSSST